MYFSNIDFNVVYVDPSIATAGNGTTPAKALKTLPATSSALAENTCYLIRRTAETSAVTLPVGTCSVANLLFIGMPKATDHFYKLMPSAGQSAWGADSAEYANVKAVTSSEYLSLPNIKNFALNLIYLFRDATMATQPVFAFTNTTNIGAISVDHCKFGAKGVNLELSSYTTPVTTSYSRAFVHVKSARVFSLKNTIINHVANSGGYGSGSIHSVYLETANYVAVSNVQVFVTTSQYGSGGPSGSVGVPLQMSNSGSGMFASFENITFNLLLNGTYEYLPQLFSGSGYSHVCMRNIRVETVRQLGSAPAKLSVASPLMSCTNADEFRVENITVNLPECWLIESAGRVFSFSGSSSGGMAGSGNSVPGYEKVIQNVTIQMAETNGLDSSGNGMYYSTLKSSSNLNYYAALELNFSSYYGGAESVLADNITVNHPRGGAFYGSNLQMANSRFKGSVRCCGMVADLDSVATWYPGYAIYVKDNSTVRVRQLTLGKENAAACGGVMSTILESRPAIPITVFCMLTLPMRRFAVILSVRAPPTTPTASFAEAKLMMGISSTAPKTASATRGMFIAPAEHRRV